MKRKRIVLFSLILICVLGAGVYLYISKSSNPNPKFVVAQKVDSLNGVYVYYNGGIENIGERNISADGYNIGVKYQCVEFVKRYYYMFYKHKMPDSYGNAKDFFDNELVDGAYNHQRNLSQYRNPSATKPKQGDLLVMNRHTANSYGHVAIASEVNESSIEIIQQNPGPFAPSRVCFNLKLADGKWQVVNERLLGWLRI